MNYTLMSSILNFKTLHRFEFARIRYHHMRHTRFFRHVNHHLGAGHEK